MQIFSTIRTLSIAMILIFVQSCSTIESTVDSTWSSISEAGDFIYDSVNFWDEDEPEQSEAVIIEEAVEVLEYAIPDESYFEPRSGQAQNFSTQQNFRKVYDSGILDVDRHYLLKSNHTLN